MKNKYNRSLRYKLLAIIIIIPSIGMGVYSFLAVQLFVKDKKAYILDAAVTVSKALSTQVKMEINAFEQSLHPVLDFLDKKTFKISPRGGKRYLEQNLVEHLFVFQPMGNGIFEERDHLYLPSRTIQNFNPGGEVLEVALRAAQDAGFAIQEIKESKRFFLITQKMGDAANKRAPLVMAVYKAPYLYESFAAPSGYKSYLVSKQNIISMEPKYVRKKRSASYITNVKFFEPLFFNRFPVGIAELQTDKGDDMFAAFAKVGFGNLIVSSVISKKDALGSVDKLVFESIVFLLALISLVVMVGVLVAFGMTSTLRKLVDATKMIAKGNFGIKIDIDSRDELHQLSDSIQVMAKEVQFLMTESATKVIMEHELQTVKTTHDLLFPENHASLGPLEIAAVCEPASECSGDWFYYYKTKENKAMIWVGDVTGHGAQAALVTSAARAASAIIQQQDGITPSMALHVLNTAIHGVAKGNILMTFFLAEIDLKTGKIIYSSASHEPPFVLPAKNNLKKKDFIPLCDAEGTRLGESPYAEYTEAEYQLSPGDSLLMYTDGVNDLENEEGKTLGERGFMQKVGVAFKATNTAEKSLEALKIGLGNYQGEASLKDDLTVFICKYNPEHSA